MSFAINPAAERSKYKSILQETLPPCLGYRTRSSVDDLKNPLDEPRNPYKYKPPFRRNFRYFGYPEDLNLDLNTPPRVRSWGPAPEQPPGIKPKRVPFRVAPDEEGFDPYWIGRLLKSNLLLENPGLLPVLDKAVENLGKQPIQLVHPDFEHTNCPSELYFPLSRKSRQAFCKINKIAQGLIDKDVKDYVVQHHTVVANKKLAGEVKRSEHERKSKLGILQFKKARRSNFSLSDFQTKTADTLFYETRTVPPIMKTFCIDKNYPGLNKQVYGRPKDSDDGDEDMVVKEYDRPTGGLQIPFHQQLNIPEDLWTKLAKVRSHRGKLAKVQANKKKKEHSPAFTPLELRNQVLQEATLKFLNKLKRHVEAPLPPELYRDNRNIIRPHHDYLRSGELPPQGPFLWKGEPELPATPEEISIVDKFIDEQRGQHHFSHHLPGLVYMPRHPFQHVELDWVEEGAEMSTAHQEARKTPTQMFNMPAYFLEMDATKFKEKLSTTISEGVQDLIGPEMYALYRAQQGLQSPEVSEYGSAEEITSGRESSESIIEDEETEQQPQPQQEEVEDDDDEYKLDADLEEEEIFPLPDVRFSSIEFPKDGYPAGVKDDLKYFRKEVERATPVRKDEEEHNDEGRDSNTSSSSDEEEMDEPISRLSHDAISHLQVMYQDAVKSKYKSLHRQINNRAQLEPPDLRNVFLNDDYSEDIDHLLHDGDKVPQFLQAFQL